MKNKLSMKAIEKISSTAKNPEDIKWNFTKFLVDRNGNVVQRYSPTFKPEDMEEKIKELIWGEIVFIFRYVNTDVIYQIYAPPKISFLYTEFAHKDCYLVIS